LGGGGAKRNTGVDLKGRVKRKRPFLEGQGEGLVPGGKTTYSTSSLQATDRTVIMVKKVGKPEQEKGGGKRGKLTKLITTKRLRK